jgi:hypothetical protein
MNPERVHTTMVSIGENLGSKKPIQQIVAVSLTKKQPILEQKIFRHILYNANGTSSRL